MTRHYQEDKILVLTYFVSIPSEFTQNTKLRAPLKNGILMFGLYNIIYIVD